MASHLLYDYRTVDLDPVLRAMLDYAVKLCRDPWAMTETDVQQLGSHGVTDEQILSVVLITCYFSFINRMMQALGQEFSQRRWEAIEKWLTGPARQQAWLMNAAD